MNNHAKILQAIAKVVREKVENCKECGGSGEISVQPKDGSTVPDGLIPCPTCAPLRDLLENYLCWHKFKSTDGGTWYGHCIHCGCSFDNFIPNPDLTTTMKGSMLLIVWIMIEAGIRKKFIRWHTDQSYIEIFGLPSIYKIGDVSAEILTDGELLCEAIAAFLEVE